MAVAGTWNGVSFANIASIYGVPLGNIASLPGGLTIPVSGPTAWVGIPIPVSSYFNAGRGACISTGGDYMFIANIFQYWVNTYLYKSVNKGDTWVQRGISNSWTNISCSTSGQYVYAAANGGYNGGNAGVWKSSDYGETFSQVYSAGGAHLNSLVCNSTGQYVFTADYYGPFIYSTDYGVNWNSVSVLSNIQAMGCSDSGQYVFISGGNGGMYRSTNYGINNWTSVDAYGYINFANSLEVSSTGQYILACSWSHVPQFSSNYGSSFSQLTAVPSTAYWSCLTGDASKLYICNGSKFWESSNYGVSWSEPVPSTQQYYSICCSRDGYVISIPSYGTMYIYR